MTSHYIYAPETLIKAYSCGVFPMAESRHDPELRFYKPAIRGVIPINPPHIPRRLFRQMRCSNWHLRLNSNFKHVIHMCAELRHDNTWINPQIEQLYFALHKMGFAHSVEIWDEQKMVGGLYGVSLGAAFFGESMFSIETNASKMALGYLMIALHRAQYHLLDAQFSSGHLMQFGLIEMEQEHFKEQLEDALALKRRMPVDAQQADLCAYFAQLKSVTS